MAPGAHDRVVEGIRVGVARVSERCAQHGVVELVLVVLHVRLLPSAPQP